HEHQAVAAARPGLLPQHLAEVGAADARPAAQPQRRDVLADAGDRARVVVHEQAGGRAAAQRLQPERAAAREEVERGVPLGPPARARGGARRPRGGGRGGGGGGGGGGPWGGPPPSSPATILTPAPAARAGRRSGRPPPERARRRPARAAPGSVRRRAPGPRG